MYFNSRPSARGDSKAKAKKSKRKQFQFTPLREGRRLGQTSGNVPKDFNSRPSARGDEIELDKLGYYQISIHAPPRGATRWMQKCNATSKFQFTPLREGRLHVIGFDIESRWISIHAPPRGATRGGGTVINSYQHFNSRPSARGDVSNPSTASGFSHFNSRPSARGDKVASTRCM